MLQLIARVNGRVIRRLVADHGRDDFEPAHSQAAQRAGVALTFFPVGPPPNLRCFNTTKHCSMFFKGL